MQTADLASLLKLSTLLSSEYPPGKTSATIGDALAQPLIPHYLWIEQPENIPTCIALAPNRREKAVRRALDKCSCRLWKG